MANHGFVTTKRTIDSNRITTILNDLSVNKFNNLVTVKYDDNYWQIIPISVKYGSAISIWKTSRRKLEARHAPGDFMRWVFAVALNEIALEYDGIISDEGISDRWKGEANLYPTFLSYVKASCNNNLSLVKMILLLY